MSRGAPSRRTFLGVAAAGLSSLGSRPSAGSEPVAPPATPGQAPKPPAPPTRPFLTRATDFVDVSRGNPKPHTLRGEALEKARLTRETWRLEIVADASAQVARPCRIEDDTALDFAALEELGKTHGVAYLKAMQCNNIPSPLGQGLWEGVPLREVVRRVGRVGNVRRLYYSGFHNNDEAQLFRSSLAFNRAMETPPWEPPPIVAYRLNGEPIPPVRGGPVRLVVPWAHGFKSIKWLQKIVLTNDYQANDTYALQNNDPESYHKTAAYLPRTRLEVKAGAPVVIEGTAMVGWSGLERVESWLRPGDGSVKDLPDDDPAWASARWNPCAVMPAPDDWSAILPPGTSASRIWGFDQATGRPKTWPLLFSMISWTTELEGLAPGSYEFRARAVDLNGFAQPEPRPYQKSGMNRVPCLTITVTA